MTWGTALKGWPTRTVFRQPARPDRSPRTDNVRAALGWPGEPQANTGLRWTQRNTPLDQTFTTICWAPELRLFCAVSATSSGTRFITSPDGVNWTAQTPPGDRIYYGICWSPELRLFCAVSISGTGNRVATSPNGIDWTLQATPLDLSWFSVAWSPQLKLFCAFDGGSGASFCMTSPDGVTWTLQSIPKTSNWRMVTWAPELGIFCVISSISAFALTSPDGVNWTQRAFDPGGANNFVGLAWSSPLRMFVAVSQAQSVNGAVIYSRDGSLWQIANFRAPYGFNSVVSIPEMSAFCANSEGATIVSRNGIDWFSLAGSALTATGSIQNNQLGGFFCCWSPELRMLCATRASGTGNRISTSP